MNDAFTSSRRQPSPKSSSPLRVPSPKERLRAAPISPMASASETETDTPITFKPKRRQDSMELSARAVSQVRAALLNSGNESGSEGTVVVSSGSSDTAKTAVGSPAKAGTPRLVQGPIMTEEELMRRRRLLDSYILD